MVAEARRTHEKEIEGVNYKSMLPPEQKPPVSLNAPTMAKYRDAMREHYIKEKPVFS